MQMNRLLLLVVVTFAVCSSSVFAAENSNPVATDSNTEFATEGRRYLKGSKTTADVDAVDEERVGATTPSFGMLTGLFRLPKFQGLSKLPLLKQLAEIQKKFGKKVGDLYLKMVTKRYNSNPNNFM